MKWIAETASRTALEKKKAMSIMARSYVYFYTTSPFRKFNTDLYDLEDDPNSSQKYLWYWYQQRNEERVNVVNETNWKVLTYKDNNWKDQSFIAPYSTCTKRNENWELKRKTLEQASWNDETIWDLHKFGINIIQATEDPYWECDSKQSAWHQVWLSWNWSEVLASQHWYTYDQIINYYFKNVTIKKINEMK
jgi:peptidoglycan hydrolase-like amidase